MRLIDADALREVMYHEAFEKDTDMQKWDSGCWIRYKMFENEIENAPTIDAVPMDKYMDLHNHFVDWEPVRHGKWYNPNPPGRSDGIMCSLCGYDSIGLYNYCPNCGAKMEGAEHE